MWTRRGFLATASAAAATLGRAQTQAPSTMQMPMHNHATPTFEEMTAALEAKTGSSIADVGAGSGSYTFRLAPLVGAEGRVWAVDITKTAIRQLLRKAADENQTNVHII